MNRSCWGEGQLLVREWKLHFTWEFEPTVVSTKAWDLLFFFPVIFENVQQKSVPAPRSCRSKNNNSEAKPDNNLLLKSNLDSSFFAAKASPLASPQMKGSLRGVQVKEQFSVSAHCSGTHSLCNLAHQRLETLTSENAIQLSACLFCSGKVKVGSSSCQNTQLLCTFVRLCFGARVHKIPCSVTTQYSVPSPLECSVVCLTAATTVLNLPKMLSVVEITVSSSSRLEETS